jgi:DNA-binding XRE family transcriptional regulator
VSLSAWNHDLGTQIRRARHQAGLSQKGLAERLGISLWTLDQLERGRGDVVRYVAEMGQMGLVAQPADAVSISTQPVVSTPDTPFRSRAGRIVQITRIEQGHGLVLGSIAFIILIRLFTEVVPVVPRALNFIDVPIFVVLSIAALARPRDAAVSRLYVGVASPALLFLGICLVSALVNPTRVAAGPALVFTYGFLSPLAVYASVYRLWPSGSALSLSRLLVALGVVQLLVVFTIDLGRFVSSGHNPDLISGTFGTNGYQLVFFLLVFTGVLSGIATFEPRRLIARAAPVLFLLVLATVFLAQYRALLVATGVSVLLIGALLVGRARGIAIVVAIVMCFGVTLYYVASHFRGLKLGPAVAALEHSPTFYARERLRAAGSVVSLYSDTPRYIFTGTGPGTFSSRGWQTFALSKSKSKSNVQGTYASALVGGQVYHTDVSDKYVLPRLQGATVIQGSRALSSPYSSYLSLMAEVGLLGFFVIGGLYLFVWARVLAMTRRAIRSARQSDPVLGLLIGAAVAFTTLPQMALLENWLEVTRVTFVSWALLAVATKELANRASQPE